jgi:hypothetical protein
LNVNGVVAWTNDADCLTLTETSTLYELVGSNACCTPAINSAKYAGTISETLSNEYTNSVLSANVIASLPAFSGTFDSFNCQGALYDLDDDEVTMTQRKIEYKFLLPALTGYPCYRLTWRETFIPSGTATTVSTSMTYVWDGSATETPVYQIPVPTYFGYVDLFNIVASCACS